MKRLKPPRRSASVLPMLAVCLISLFGFVGLAVDLGMLAVSRTQCQNAADAAALVGARNLNNQQGSVDTNRAAALAVAEAAVKNNAQLNRYLQDADIQSIVAGQYSYNPGTQRFAVSYPGSIAASNSWSAMRVELATVQPTYFMRVLGVTSMPTGAVATAVHRPRDVAFALDFTGSMGWSSPMNWPYMYGPTYPGMPIEGVMNPDPAYPKFGHYSRYTYYQNAANITDSTISTIAGSASISNRQNPLQMVATYSDSSGSYSPGNHTIATSGGPPIIEDFLTAPGDPPSVSQSTSVLNAFKNSVCPAPSNFDVQSDSPVPYIGDKWPRTDGNVGGPSGAWSTVAGSSFNDSGVYTLQQFLNSKLGPRDLTQWMLSMPPGGTADQLRSQINGNTQDGGDSDANYFDTIWEKYGYDLDVASLNAGSKTAKLRAGSQFQGFSMGPGYWGKTFFIWPPDPRFDLNANVASPDPARPAFDSSGKPMCDWRRRFFLRGDGATFDPQSDDVNAILFASTAGHTLNPIVTSVSSGCTANNCPGYYRLNYQAIMAWLKAGPQTLPSNLRSGRILYYSSIPNDLVNGAAGDPNDIMYWREYIHFIFGVGSFDPANAPLQPWGGTNQVGYTPAYMLAGVESRNPFGTLSITPAQAFTPPGSMAPNPKPYMCYTDNINRPRMHFWFGPQTMLHFLKVNGEDRPWFSGTVHESQCWQLKVAVNSVIDDIRRNHPNDYCGIAGFAYRRQTNPFNTPLATMGQDYFTLKNVLFFRKDTVARMKADPNSPAENRPYTSTLANDTDWIPNGKGSTDPNTGLAVSFNLLSTSPSLLSGGGYGTGGRRGASKIVIFETDGKPNVHKNWSLAGSGADTRYVYSSSGSPPLWMGDPMLSSHSRAAVEVVQNIVAPVSSTGPSGYSLPNAPARVYAVAFGDIFDGYPNSVGAEGAEALQFLLRVQQVGNTSASTASGIPAEQVITGPYPSRIANLKSALERIAQSGVQVTLIE